MEEITFDLDIRSLSPAGVRVQQDAIIDRLKEHVTEERIAGFTVRVWGKRVSPTSAAARTAVGRNALKRVEAFGGWAREHGNRLRAAFEDRSLTGTDESTDVIVFPAMVLAEFRGETLRFVAPCADGERRYTVAARIDSLAPRAEDGV